MQVTSYYFMHSLHLAWGGGGGGKYIRMGVSHSKIWHTDFEVIWTEISNKFLKKIS